MSVPFRLCVLADPQSEKPLPNGLSDDQINCVCTLAMGSGYVDRLVSMAPDLVLVDLRQLGAAASASVAAAIHHAVPKARVLAVGPPAALEQAMATLAQGVWGYVTRDVGAVELTHALRKLATGGVYMTGTARKAMSKALSQELTC